MQIFLVEMSNRVLGMYDEEISKYTKGESHLLFFVFVMYL